MTGTHCAAGTSRKRWVPDTTESCSLPRSKLFMPGFNVPSCVAHEEISHGESNLNQPLLKNTSPVQSLMLRGPGPLSPSRADSLGC